MGESKNENDAKWRAATSLFELVDVVKPMVEVDGVKWRAATSLLELLDVVAPMEEGNVNEENVAQKKTSFLTIRALVCHEFKMLHYCLACVH